MVNGLCLLSFEEMTSGSSIGQTLVNQGAHLKSRDALSKDGNVYQLHDIFITGFIMNWAHKVFTNNYE